MEQVLGSTFGDRSRIWSLMSPMRSFGIGTGIPHNFQEMALSILSTMLILNLASTLRLLPNDLYMFFLGYLRRWLHQEINIKIPNHNQDFYPIKNGFIDESRGDFYSNCNIFCAAETYLSAIATSKSNSHCTSLLRASADRGGRNVILTIDDSQVIVDTFLKDHMLIVIKWRLHHEQAKEENSSRSNSYHKKYFMLTFDGRKAGLDVVREYLKHVIATSEKIMSQNRQLKLYTNSRNGGMPSSAMWNMVMFNHPASFDTFAMDPTKKKKIMEDLDTFSKCRDYYAKIGKAWKRGYLLYGPPGTGKSTMIACIANYLKYDIYDLELTAVMNNTHLRQLMVNLPSKAIIVIEDIDCSLDLSGARKPVTREEEREETMTNVVNSPWNINGHMMNPYVNTKDSNVTLSGLLNCIDGLWSTCGGERLVVFTTNHVDKLDPALIRKGRMDVQVELSYCKVEAFKVLAKNYLGVDEHPLYERVEELLEEVEITPADVAELLLPKNIAADDRAEECLEELISKMEKIRDAERKT